MSTDPSVPRPHYTQYDSRLGSYAVIVRAGDERGAQEVLLALWNDGRWTLPGGGVELHESPEEGAVREVREETGYDVALDRLLGVETDVIPAEGRSSAAVAGRPLKAIRVYFTAHVTGGELTHEQQGSTREAAWHPLDSVAGLPRSSMVDTGLRLLGR